jgi:hypothetical protein
MRAAGKTLLTAVIALVALSSGGCSDDCEVYCGNQSDFIDQCLPEFGQSWADVGAGDWTGSSDFAAACNENIALWIEEDIEEACSTAEAGSDEADACADTVRQGTLRACGEHLNDFRVSCADYWQGTLDFVPGAFDPVPPGDDDDSAAGDDDDSAAGDDDDSAVGDDDDSAAGDDDDSAAGDDDDSAGDDDDSAGDDDDSASGGG